MEKKKETPWTEKKLMYKDGNVDVYRYFNWETWKRMTEGERAMWTESSEATPAPISAEVIDFNKKIAAEADKIITPKSKVVEVTHPITISDEKTELITATYKVDTTEIDIMRAELKERGIKFAYNSKLSTLKKKLADADNTE